MSEQIWLSAALAALSVVILWRIIVSHHSLILLNSRIEHEVAARDLMITTTLQTASALAEKTRAIAEQLRRDNETKATELRERDVRLAETARAVEEQAKEVVDLAKDTNNTLHKLAANGKP